MPWQSPYGMEPLIPILKGFMEREHVALFVNTALCAKRVMNGKVTFAASLLPLDCAQWI